MATALGVALCACQPQAKPPPSAAQAAAAPAPSSPELLAAASPALDKLYADSGGAIGMVVAVVRSDQQAVRGYGHVGPTDARAPDGVTLVRLDSISKLLTAELLAKLTAAHRLQLSDPLTEHAPVGWTSRTPTATAISLLELATHTAGLPRVAPYAIAPIPPSADAAAAERWAWLAERRDARQPGEYAHYSNLGFDFLGDALAAAAGATYDAALHDWVTAPLGMADTTPDPTSAQCARMMAGDPGYSPPPCSDQSFQAASGGVYSTADDMALWMKSQLAPGPLDPVRRISQAIYIQRETLRFAQGLDVAGPANGIGLAWIELAPDGQHPRLIEKTGGGWGFMTYVVMDPTNHIGVFLAVDKLGHGRLERLAEDANDLAAALGPNDPSELQPPISATRKVQIRN